MLNFEEIKELIEMVAGHQMAGVEVQKADFRLKIDGYSVGEPAKAAEPVPTLVTQALAAPASAPASAPVAPTAPAPAKPAPVADQEPAAANDEGEPPPGSHIMTSPIVGTFYRSPNPDADPFVDVGSQVSKGQVLCIVEAMKLMNEIESDIDGEVVGIYPKNAQPVEFGERLFAIKPS